MGEGMVMETCPHCASEIEMHWDTDKMGFKAFCPVCGNPIMLCDECRYAKTTGPCDYDSKTGACRQNTEIGKSMKRLTRWFRGVPEYVGRYAGVDPEKIAPVWRNIFLRDRPININLEVMERLAAYEDTGLTPREIAVLKRSVGGHLLELQRMEIEKRLVILPVAPLGYLYEPARRGEEPTALKNVVRCIGVTINQNGDAYFMIRASCDEKSVFHEFGSSLIGKDYFLTREEAVEASRKQLEAQANAPRPGG